MTPFKKHDRVYFYCDHTGKLVKIFGYVQCKLRQLYFIIDDAGKEWAMYEEELRPVTSISYKEILKHVKHG